MYRRFSVLLLLTALVFLTFVGTALALPVADNIDADKNSDFLLLEWDNAASKLYMYGDYRLIPEQGDGAGKQVALQLKRASLLQGSPLRDTNGNYAIVNGEQLPYKGDLCSIDVPLQPFGNSLSYHVQWTDSAADDEHFVVEYIDIRTYVKADYDPKTAKHVFSVWVTENGKRVPPLSGYSQGVTHQWVDRDCVFLKDTMVITASSVAGSDLSSATGYLLTQRKLKDSPSEYKSVARRPISLLDPKHAVPTPAVARDPRLGFDLSGDLTKPFTYVGELPEELSGKPVRLVLRYGVQLEQVWPVTVEGNSYSFSILRGDFPGGGLLVVECNVTGQDDGWVPLVRGEVTASHLDASVKFTIGQKTYVANGEARELEAAPFVRGSSTLVPVRALDALGTNIGWDARTRTATFKLGLNTVKVTVGSRVAEVNGRQEIMPIAPELVSGRTMVPFRFIGESLGLKVHYASATREITISR